MGHSNRRSFHRSSDGQISMADRSVSNDHVIAHEAGHQRQNILKSRYGMKIIKNNSFDRVFEDYGVQPENYIPYTPTVLDHWIMWRDCHTGIDSSQNFLLSDCARVQDPP